MKSMQYAYQKPLELSLGHCNPYADAIRDLLLLCDCRPPLSDNHPSMIVKNCEIVELNLFFRNFQPEIETEQESAVTDSKFQSACMITSLPSI